MHDDKVKQSIAQRRAALGMREPTDDERRDNLAARYDFWINATFGPIQVKSDPTLKPGEFRIEQTTPRQWAIGVDHGKPGADHAVIATKCARCGLVFASKPDADWSDYHLENEVFAHQEKCVAVGNYVRWSFMSSWFEGEVVSLVGIAHTVRVVAVSKVWYAFEPRPFIGGTRHCRANELRRIPRPAQVGGNISPLMPSVMVATTEPSNAMPGLEAWLPAPPPAQPAPVLYDGLTARECWHHWCDNVHWIETRGPKALHAMTPHQIAAAKIENVEAMKAWPERLRAKVAASAEAERCRVRCDLQCDEDEPW